jgi:hypothetical protein
MPQAECRFTRNEIVRAIKAFEKATGTVADRAVIRLDGEIEIFSSGEPLHQVSIIKETIAA